MKQRGASALRVLIVDGKSDRWITEALANPTETLLLSIGCPPLAVTNVLDIKHISIEKLAVAPVSRFSALARQALREFVPSFYAELPLRNIKEGVPLASALFPEDKESWWLTDISEKSIFRGLLISRLYALALTKFVIDEYKPGQIWIELEDVNLSDCISQAFVTDSEVRIFCKRTRFGALNWIISFFRPSYERLFFFFRCLFFAWGTAAEFFFSRLIMLGLNQQVSSEIDAHLDRPRLALFSFFPVWWRNPWDSAERKEVFFQDLPRKFASEAITLCHVVWLHMGGNGWLWLRNMPKIRNLVREKSFLVLQLSCHWLAGFSLLRFGCLAHSRRIFGVPTIKLDGHFYGFQIGLLVHEEIQNSLSNREFFQNLLLRDAVSRLPHLDGLIFRSEFQPFERAILMGIDGKIVTIGYQHSSIGEDYLSHVFVPDQINCQKEFASFSIPLPDHLIVTGNYPAEMMWKSGFLRKRVHICGPVRYPELRKITSHDNKIELNNINLFPPYNLLVPVSLDRTEAEGLALILATALKGCEENFLLCIKGHPANDHSSYFAEYLVGQNPNINCRVLELDGPLYDFIRNARALVMTGSTVGLEALALGIVPIVYVNPHMFSFTVSSLSAVKDAVVLVDDPVTMRQALEELMVKGLPFPHVREHRLEAIEAMFHDLQIDAEARFVAVTQEIMGDNLVGS